jgi:hypothetical protein
VRVLDGNSGDGVSRTSVRVAETLGNTGASEPVVVLSAPENAAAAESLKEAVSYGLRSLQQSAAPDKGASAVAVDVPREKRDDHEVLPAFP